MTTRLDDLEEDADTRAEAEAGTEAGTDADAGPGTEADPPDEDADPPPPSGFFRPRRVAVALGVVAALLAGGGAWGLVAAHELRSSGAAHNSALVDTGATAEVSAAVSSALSQIFSYSYDNTAATERAAAAVLRGDALETYNRLFAEVRDKAPGQKLVLTTRVAHSAVRSLEGDRARLLVFLDQSATRVDTGTSNAAAAQLSVTAKRVGGRWVITDMAPR
jgi:Mce-associated membrane protein